MPYDLPRRADYRQFREIPTRWSDQDSFGHINNAVYYTYYDTVVASFLGGTGLVDASTSPLIGVVVETLCRFHAPAHFPEVLTAGLRVGKIGRTSVRYEMGFFRPGQDTTCAEGHFVHVYVSRARQQEKIELPEALRQALMPLLVG